MDAPPPRPKRGETATHHVSVCRVGRVQAGGRFARPLRECGRGGRNRPQALAPRRAAIRRGGVVMRMLINGRNEEGEEMAILVPAVAAPPGGWVTRPRAPSQHRARWMVFVGWLLLCAGQLHGDAGAPAAVITVYMRNARACPPRVLDEMHAEAAAILRPAGIALAWRHFPHSRHSEPVSSLIVFSFSGACCSGMRPGPAGSSKPLGWTHWTDGEILPFCVVDCDRIREVVSPIIQYMPLEARDFHYGRALGRVAAHEMYHVIASTTVHASRGLAKPLLTASELVSGACRFTAVELDMMRNAAMRGFRVVTRDCSAHPNADRREQTGMGGK